MSTEEIFAEPPLQSSLLERRAGKLRLIALETMRDSVADYYRRVRSRPGVWSPKMYPTGTEKELYAQFAHILLSNPPETIRTLLELYDTDPAKNLRSRVLDGRWQAYRVSNRRRDPGSRLKKVKSPLIFPGGAGQGGIADVVLLLNPCFVDDSRQIRADLLLYFELKSSDHHRQDKNQLRAHLAALSRSSLARNAFLAGIGGRPVELQHARWLGHSTLGRFLQAMSRVAIANASNRCLAGDIKHLCKVHPA